MQWGVRGTMSVTAGAGNCMAATLGVVFWFFLFVCLFVLGSTQQGLILSEFEWEVFPQGVLQ